MCQCSGLLVGGGVHFVGYVGVAEEGDLTVFQEVDLMCEERELWCEVKAWKTLVTDNEEVGSERCETSSSPPRSDLKTLLIVSN